ncbi:hypothetical protein G6F40_017834 [Rhizopus arrhizus]|nr:hypothetical protein G6F40_017834 [Rhizopus arrhizus]
MAEPTPNAEHTRRAGQQPGGLVHGPPSGGGRHGCTTGASQRGRVDSRQAARQVRQDPKPGQVPCAAAGRAQPRGSCRGRTIR